MAVTTWSFNSGFNGFTFAYNDIPTDASEIGKTFDGTATRSYVTGAIRTVLTLPNVANVTVAANHYSPSGLGVQIQNGDTIDVDYSATTLSAMNVYIEAYYTDATSESVSVDDSVASTLTLTLTQNKILNYFRVRLRNSTSGSAAGYTNQRDILEIRLTTAGATPSTVTYQTPTWFINNQGAGASGGAGGGAGGNIADISADGLYIYIAVFGILGTPQLIRIGAPLSADGSIVFDPGDGGRIGVQCGKLNNSDVWVAGEFDGTNTVEKSEDAGSSFTVKDDATFGAIRTFQVGPNNDDKIIIFDGDNGDLIQSIDDGATWTTTNAAVTSLVNSIARYGANPEEIVLGNQGAANDSIDYSVNEGVNLEDYQTGVYPNADNTKVIVN